MLPTETISAVFPHEGTIKMAKFRLGVFPGRTFAALRPMTLLHATAMEAFGVDLDRKEIDGDHMLIAAWILAQTPDQIRREMTRIEDGQATRDFAEWARNVRETPDAISAKVNREINLAFHNCVPAQQSGKPNLLSDGMPQGYGWPIEIAEAMCAEYGMSFREAMETPMASAFAMIACERKRYEVPSGGPDYYDRIRVKRMHEEKLRRQAEADVAAKKKED